MRTCAAAELAAHVAVDYGVVQPKLRSWLYSLHQVFPEFFLGHVQLARIPIGGGKLAVEREKRHTTIRNARY